MSQLFVPPYQPCHILHGKSVVTYRPSALLHLAEFSIASSMGPNKTIPITDIIEDKNDWAKIYCTERQNDKTRTTSGFIGAALQRIYLEKKTYLWVPTNLMWFNHQSGSGESEMWHQKPLPLILVLKGGCSPEWLDLLDLDCFGVEYGELPSLNP